MAESFYDHFECHNRLRNTAIVDNMKIEATGVVEREQKFSPLCSSTGSLHTPNSSAHNTDEDDSDRNPISYRERRREAHTQAEQKRRDAIKKGYDLLQDLVPMRQQSEAGYKLSKATVLQKSIDYIQYLHTQKKKLEEERNSLRKEVQALSIMHVSYEQLVRAQQSREPSGHVENHVSDEAKFQVFKAIIEQLYKTFCTTISFNSFAELSSGVIMWLEEYCKPQTFRRIVQRVLDPGR